MSFTVTGFSLICFVFAVCAVRGWARRELVWPLSLTALGSLAYVVSSLVNATSLGAIDVPAFPAIGLYLCGIAVMARRLSDVVSVLIGASLGSIAFYVFVGTDLTSGAGFADLWKYGLAPSVSVLALTAVTRGRRRHPAWGCGTLVALAAVSVVLNFRSHAVICLAAAVIVGIDALRRRPLPVVGKAVVCVVLGVCSSLALSAAAGLGLLGSALTAKVDLQASQHVPALLAGRTEPPLSLTAIAHRPLLGWGDANTLPASVFDDAYQLAYRWGFDLSYPLQRLWRSADGAVSLHSILLGSWAEAGILGALLPLWLVGAAIALVALAPRIAPLTALLTFLGLQSMWDLAFSPWSYNLPLVFAIIAVLVVRLRALSPGEQCAGDMEKGVLPRDLPRH